MKRILKQIMVLCVALLLLTLGLAPAAGAQQGPPENGNCGRGPIDRDDPDDGEGPNENASDRGEERGRGPELDDGDGDDGDDGDGDDGEYPEGEEDGADGCRVGVGTQNQPNLVFIPGQTLSGALITVESDDDDDEGARGAGGARTVLARTVADDDGSYEVSVPIAAAGKDGRLALMITSHQASGATTSERLVIDVPAVEPASDAGPASSAELGVQAPSRRSAPQRFVAAVAERPQDGYSLLVIGLVLAFAVTLMGWWRRQQA